MEIKKIDFKDRLLFFITILVPLVPFYFQDYDYKIVILVLGYYIGLFPLMFSYFYNKKKFLIFELHCFFYSIFFFLLPIILINKYDHSDKFFFLTSLISIFGLIILIITFYLLNFFNIKKKYLLSVHNEPNIFIIYYIFFIVFLIFKLFTNSNSSLYFYFLVGFNYYLILNLDYKSNKLAYLSLVTQNIILFIYTIYDFVFMDSILFLIDLLAVKWFFKKKINWFFIFIIILLVTSSSGIKNIYRYQQSINLNEKYNSIFFIKNFFSKDVNNNLISAYNFQDYSKLNTSAAISRLEWPYLSLNIAIKKTPEIIPYLWGESYLPIFFKILPSLIFKHQYQENFGNKFGRLYEFANYYDYQTSFNVPFITEFYINFGIIGVSLGMIIIGFFFYILENFFISKKKKFNLNNLIILTCSIPLCIPESNLSLMLGAFFQNLLIIFIIIFFLNKFFFIIRNKFI